jgi:hypothetical protein
MKGICNVVLKSKGNSIVLPNIFQERSSRDSHVSDREGSSCVKLSRSTPDNTSASS